VVIYNHHISIVIGVLNAVGRNMPSVIHNHVVVPFGRLQMPVENRDSLTLEHVSEVFPAAENLDLHHLDPIEKADQICEILRDGCDLQRSHEHLFLLLYFGRVIDKLKEGATLNCALLPLPKARFSLAGEQPGVTVDFAFWNGQKFVAVFIHESRYNQPLPADAGLLKIWGFDVYCLMADEFETRGLMGNTGLKILEALQL